jgi:predicted signal transduction protein with EAL and GGDEF domain
MRVPAQDTQWGMEVGVVTRRDGVIVSRDELGQPTAMTGTISDVTAKKESEELGWRHANLDTLTGLPNRRHFRGQLDSDIRKAHRTVNKAALLFIDLDGFKQVND